MTDQLKAPLKVFLQVEDESQSLYADKISLQNDWLAMHAELEVRAELIEEQEGRLLNQKEIVIQGIERERKLSTELSTLRTSINAAMEEILKQYDYYNSVEGDGRQAGVGAALGILRSHGLIPEEKE